MPHLRDVIGKVFLPRQIVPSSSAPRELFDGIARHWKNGSAVEVRPSSVPNANLGVFATRRIRLNDVLTLYPGDYYHPPTLCSVAEAAADSASTFQLSDLNSLVFTKEEASSVYRITCEGGGFIDAARDAHEKQRHSALAIAHRINHDSKRNNCHPVTFNWHEYVKSREGTGREGSLAAERLSHCINRVNEAAIWYVDAQSGLPVFYSKNCALLKGIAFVASREIEEGEELYLNYRLRQAERPSWYR